MKETQWNDAQIRFGEYDHTMKQPDTNDELHGDSNSISNSDGDGDVDGDSDSDGEFGASADLHLDKENFTFVFDRPNRSLSSSVDDDDDDDDGNNNKIRIVLQGYQSKSNVTYCSTGLTLWPAAENLCDHMIKNQPTMLHGKRILELGSGLGLCGLLAHHVTDQSAFVYLTDGDTDVLHHLRKNIKENKIESCISSSTTDADDPDHANDGSNKIKPRPTGSRLSCDQLLWSRENAKHFLENNANNQTFDVIIASDIIYAMNVVQPMWETVQSLLKRGGMFLFAFARRQVAVSIEQVLEAGVNAGFEYEECEETDLDQNLFLYIFRWKV